MECPVFALRLIAVSLCLAGTVRPDMGAPGPWGRLRYAETFLEPPPELVPADPVASEPDRWVIEQVTPETLAGWFTAHGVNREHAEQLASLSRPGPITQSLAVEPTSDLLLALEPGQRAALYASLGRSGLNPQHRDPLRFPDANLSEWVEGHGLTEETQRLLQRLAYPRSSLWLFSDADFLLRRLPDIGERQALMRVLLRQQVVLANVVLGSEDNMDTLTAYWGIGFRNHDVRPLLEAAQRAGGRMPISVQQLLPAFARERLYRYDAGVDGVFRDCHWSSLNFFNQTPDDRFLEVAFVRETVLTAFARTRQPPRLGDLVLLRDKDQAIVHSGVYVADQLIFTKNGGRYTQPWILMHLDDLRAYYTLDGPLEVLFMRPRD